MNKICTNIEQSKKLIELGIDVNTADMHYYKNSFGDYIEGLYNSSDLKEGCELKGIEYIPAWSLASLLDVFPPYLFEFERGIDFNIYPNLNGKGWHCSYMPNYIENMKKDKFKLITSGDDPIDACVEMIEKLHEQNLI